MALRDTEPKEKKSTRKGRARARSAREILNDERAALYRGDAIAGMSRFEDGSFDLAIADPPYGASTSAQWRLRADHGLSRFGGAWKLADHQWDMLAGIEGFQFTLAWLSELGRLVRPGGSIWIHSTYHNSGLVNIACQLLGLEIINEVVWYKRNAFPNIAAKRLTASHETILWVHTGGPNNRAYQFNYEEVKAASFAGDSLKSPGRQLRTVWDVPNNKEPGELSHGRHPTQKPLRLLSRMFLVSGLRGGRFFAPFAGAGSEMVAALRYGMHATGFELDPGYCEIARRRLIDAMT